MRKRTATLAVLGVVLATVLAPATGATAAEGPAPEPREHRIIAGVHTDAVSTFLDDGRLALATKADVAEGNGTRFDPAGIWFHLTDDAKTTVPAGYEFIAPPGSPAWIAPESNPGAGLLWPGFSTESTPDITGTTFTLTELDGPGSLELFTAAGFGGVKRLWSSDEDAFRAFSVGRTHMHANWAFTAAGTYRIGVEAAAGGQTAHATYTFVVGGLPTATATSTALTTSTAAIVAGERVRLDATVTPADAPGWVEFADGDTVLGHIAVSGGRAALDVTTLPLGNRALTARFVPHVLNHFTRSASPPVPVTVTESAGGEVFGITGLADRYQTGDQIDLGVTGATLRDGDTWRWLIRPAGMTTSFAAGSEARYRRDATSGLNGSSIRVQIRDAARVVVQQSDWLTINVDGVNVGTGESVTVTGWRDAYNGDPVRVTVAHRALTAGETGRWMTRYVPSGTTWAPVSEYGHPQQVPGTTDQWLMDTAWLNSIEWAYEIAGADGTMLGRSPAYLSQIGNRELQLSGIRTVYRAGDTLRAESSLYPPRDDVTYRWQIAGGADLGTGPTLELPVTADLDGQSLYLAAVDATTGMHIAGAQQLLRVTDSAPGEQLLFLDSLAGHYHQGDTIRLNASADPAASDTDVLKWRWQRPDQQRFTTIDKPTDGVRAEQALDGTQVVAELYSAAGTLLATSEPATIHVDDHGAAPQQKVTVDGLTATVNPPSVLTRWEWWQQRPGSDTLELIPGQNGPELSEHPGPGTTVVARLTFDDGREYVESAPTVLPDSSLTVSGMAAEYRPGDTVTLQAVQTPRGPETAHEWLVKAPGADAFTPVPGETGDSYTFTAARTLHGAQYRVKLAGTTSPAVTLTVTEPEPSGEAAKTITATIDETEGALVISVDAADRAVVLPDAALNSSGDRWESTGALKPVTVTDTRAAGPGWTASGHVADGFRAPDGSSFPGGHLGWTPQVLSQSTAQGVQPGPASPGLAEPAQLAKAPAGAGRGTARLDAELQLSVPTDTAPGTYTATLTLTAI
ncbi:choice-of-anchor M domain-containing protein [Actinoplanes sp. G11-F43]|uniref:choice-of-anchor M domain-containing protein n=1 Tax=Actinoplanes sp. G11-F43 TaxID=3424130 RepID=UPI003D332ED2